MQITGSLSMREAVRACVGDPRADIASYRVESMAFQALATDSLDRVSGETTDGTPWSMVVKRLRSMRHWPDVHLVPEAVRDRTIERFPWRAEADLYLDPPALPEGLRLPRVYLVEDLGDDRLALWLEDVREVADCWDLGRYRRAARLLGELAASRPGDGLDEGLHAYLDGPVTGVFIPTLRDPGFWRHPLVAAVADPLLQCDLLALADRVAEFVAVVEELPRFRGHGDASPSNLLVPADGSAEFVAIDWSWPYPTALGFDLGQLLCGRAHAGVLDPADLPVVHEAILAAYAEAFPGLAVQDVWTGYVASLVLRSAWTALPFEMLGQEDTPALRELFAKRAGLARFIVDLGRSLSTRG